MEYLINPEEVMTLGHCPKYVGCPTYFPCTSYCKVMPQPLYGVPTD
jgi:hypothetical protein